MLPNELATNLIWYEVNSIRNDVRYRTIVTRLAPNGLFTVTMVPPRPVV